MAVSVTGKYFITEIVIIFLGLPENQNSNNTGSGGIPKNITLTDLEIFPREPSFSYTVSKLFLNFLVCEELYF